MIGQTVSHYRILETLGEGGMGIVYLAEDTHLGRQVAIKFLATKANDHHYRARFLREARAASALSHPHIAAIYDYGETSDGQPFIVMELVKGETLSDLLAASALNLPRVLEIVEAVADALTEAHARGIVHRDIKPSNIIINERGKVKVLDFGLAKQIHEDRSHKTSPDAQTLLATQTRSGVVVGTPLYLSPEQATGTSVDGRSDLFALGAVLYECIAGRPAFSGTSVIEIGAQVIHINPPVPSSINPRITPEVDRITMKALAKRPEDRYQSAEEMVADLRRLRETHDSDDTRPIKRISSPSVEMRASALTTITESLRQPRLSIISLLGVLVLLSLAAWGIAHLWRPAPHKPTAEAERWYKAGTNALLDGAYYQASMALERAVEADDKFALAHARLADAWTELDYPDKAKDELLRVATLERSTLSQSDALYLEAITATVTRDFGRALASYQELARISPDQPQVYVDLGRAYEKSDEIKKAIESYVEATNRDAQYATAFLRVGILYGRQQELASATAAFEKAETLYQALGNVEGRAEVLYQRGLLLDNIGKVVEARDQLRRALDMARTINNQSQQIKVLLQLSSVSYSGGDTAQAQQYAREAVDLAQANGMENLTARGLVDLGGAFLAHGNYNEAEKYYKQALEFAQRYKARRNEARALFMLGSLRIQQGNPDEALRYLEPALAFYRQGGYRKEASLALLLLGRANRLKGDYDAALKAFEQQLQLAKEVGDPSQMALSHEGIGNVLVRKEEYAEALVHFEERYAISKSLGDQQSVGYSSMERADMLWQLGRYKEARQSLDEASALADQSGGDKALLAEVYLVGAGMALSERRFPEAKAKSQQALNLAGTQYTDTAAQAKRILGLAQALSGAAREGKLLCEEAVTMAERSRDPWLLSRAQLALAETMFESGDTQGASTIALEAQASFARSMRQDSEWRAWLVMARASQRAGDEAKAREYASRAAELLTNLQQKWGTEAYSGYLARPDVHHSHTHLSELLAENK
jgi:serine/threonine protein kinase/uncharacterized protein HemY